MPNWCENTVIVTGPGADDFLSKYPEGDSKVGPESATWLFEQYLPRPPEFEGMYTGLTRLPDGTAVSAWRDGPDGQAVPVTNEEILVLIEKYGTSDWHGWSVRTWGTKWDTHYRREGNQLWFETAWSPPVEFFQTVSEWFPTALFELAYAEQGMGLIGVVVIQDGAIISDTGEGSLNFYEEPRESEDDRDWEFTPVVGAHLEKYGLGPGG